MRRSMRKLFVSLLIWLALASPALAAIGTPLNLGQNSTSSGTSLALSANTANAVTAGDDIFVVHRTGAASGAGISSITDTAGDTGCAQVAYAGAASGN